MFSSFPDHQSLDAYLTIYFHFIAILEDKDKDYSKQIIKIVEGVASFKDQRAIQYFKHQMISKIINLAKLLNEVDSKLFITKIREVREFIQLLQSCNFIIPQFDIDTIAENLLKIFKFNFDGKIMLIHDKSLRFQESKIAIIPSLDQIDQLNNHYIDVNRKFVSEYLPICNFNERVFLEYQKLFDSFEPNALLSIFNYLQTKKHELMNCISSLEQAVSVSFLISMTAKSCNSNILKGRLKDYICSLIEGNYVRITDSQNTYMKTNFQVEMMELFDLDTILHYYKVNN